MSEVKFWLRIDLTEIKFMVLELLMVHLQLAHRWETEMPRSEPWFGRVVLFFDHKKEHGKLRSKFKSDSNVFPPNYWTPKIKFPQNFGHSNPRNWWWNVGISLCTYLMSCRSGLAGCHLASTVGVVELQAGRFLVLALRAAVSGRHYNRCLIIDDHGSTLHP
jgi:hypothetical protein